MPAPLRLWIHTAFNPAFACGGWAYVLAEPGLTAGAVGGERTASPDRVALAGLAEALKAARAGVAVSVASADPRILAIARRIPTLEADPPPGDLDLWAPLAAALKGRAVTFATEEARPRTPAAFALAWSELARDKSKASGVFRAVIPRTNLAKAGI